MSIKKTLKKVGRQGLVLGAVAAAGACFAADVSVGSEAFTGKSWDSETGLASGANLQWTGNGSIDSTTGQSYSGVRPISDDATTFLDVKGTVVCANTAAAANDGTQIDFLVKVAKPDEALSTELFDSVTPQLAVAVDQEGYMCAFCGAIGSGDPAWHKITAAALTEGNWVRVGLNFDYGTKLCQIAIDGNPCQSEFGRVSDATDAASGGSWYPLAITPAANKVSSISVVGVTAVDDLLFTQNDPKGFKPSYKNGSGNDIVVSSNTGISGTLKKADIVAAGFTEDQLATTDASGMTGGAKVAAGLPRGPQKLAITDMSMSNSGSTVQATLTFPAMNPASGYKNVIKYGTAPDALSNSADITAGTTSKTIDVSKAVSGPTVIYYEIVTVTE